MKKQEIKFKIIPRQENEELSDDAARIIADVILGRLLPQAQPVV